MANFPGWNLSTGSGIGGILWPDLGLFFPCRVGSEGLTLGLAILQVPSV